MRDATHDDHIVRWALFVKNNPDKWKRIHSEIIDAQFKMSEDFYGRLAETDDGKRKIAKIFNIRNIDGYPSLKQ